MRSAALGNNCPIWLQKYTADNLNFVEFERKALPCALMRPREGKQSLYTYSAADMDARSVMEQRLQSLVCCVSMVQRVLEKQPPRATSKKSRQLVGINGNRQLLGVGGGALITHGDSVGAGHRVSCDESYPILMIPSAEAIRRVWKHLETIPKLIEEHLLVKNQNIAIIGDATVEKSKDSKGKDSKDKEAKKLLDDQRVAAAVATLRGILSVLPKDLSSFKESCLALRKEIRAVVDIGTPKARYHLLWGWQRCHSQLIFPSKSCL